MVERLVEYNFCSPLSLVFSDNGNAFFPKGVSVFSRYEGITHLAWPASVHQFLSPNDNQIHAIAKQKVRSAMPVRGSDSEFCIRLIAELDKATTKWGRKFFKRNILKATRESLAGIIKGVSVDQLNFRETCKREYRLYIGEPAIKLGYTPPKDLESTLDGSHWDQNLTL